MMRRIDSFATWQIIEWKSKHIEICLMVFRCWRAPIADIIYFFYPTASPTPQHRATGTAIACQISSLLFVASFSIIHRSMRPTKLMKTKLSQNIYLSSIRYLPIKSSPRIGLMASVRVQLHATKTEIKLFHRIHTATAISNQPQTV